MTVTSPDRISPPPGRAAFRFIAWLGQIHLILILLLPFCWYPLLSHSAESSHGKGGHGSVADTTSAPHAHGAAGVGQWEGSPEGKAYSESNHHLAGFFVLLIGLSELRQSLVPLQLVWSRFLLPFAMLGAGLFLMIWSDHEAWPIGPRSLLETLSGNYGEMTQHKIFGVLLLGVGAVELIRRTGGLNEPLWKVPLPALALVGGLMLFMHAHGPHPAAHTIMINHTVMGALAITAGICKLLADRTGSQAAIPAYVGMPTGGSHMLSASIRGRWSLAWSSLILLIGLQLMAYSE
jgi:hypothetical protein